MKGKMYNYIRVLCVCDPELSIHEILKTSAFISWLNKESKFVKQMKVLIGRHHEHDWHEKYNYAKAELGGGSRVMIHSQK